MKKIMSLILVLSFFSSNIWSQAGSLDVNFGDNGGVVFNPMTYANDLFELPDGSTIVAGELGIGQLCLARVLPSGELDANFGNNGYVLTNETWNITEGTIGAYGEDKFWTIGNVPTSDAPGSLLRFYNNGQIDTTFGTDGRVVLSNDFNAFYIQDILVLENGHIIAMLSDGIFQVFLGFRTDGSVDTDFGENGMQFYNIGKNGVFDIWWPRMEVSDGSIYIGGQMDLDSMDESGFAIMKLNMDCSIDSTYGIDGLQRYALSDLYLGYDGFHILKNGKIHFSGAKFDSGSSYRIFTAQFNLDGSPDTDYGSNGIAVSTFVGNELDIIALAEQADGKLVMTGFLLQDLDEKTFLVRLNTEGSIDTSFGDNGFSYSTPFVEPEYGRLHVMKDQSILVAGAEYGLSGSPSFGIVAKYQSDLVSTNDLIVNNLPMDVFPSPVKSEVILDLDFASMQDVKISILDFSGKPVYLLNSGLRQKGHQQLYINLPNNLPSGTYLVSVEMAEGIAQSRIVVMP